MDKQSREKWANIFRSKSDESFLAAQECFKNGHYRASCNRAWYSIYQAISAGAYIRLKQEPPGERDNWNHNALDKVFHHLLRASNKRLKYTFLLDCLPSVRESRVLADYLEDDDKIGEARAKAAIIIAERVRLAVYETMKW